MKSRKGAEERRKKQNQEAQCSTKEYERNMKSREGAEKRRSKQKVSKVSPKPSTVSHAIYSAMSAVGKADEGEFFQVS